MKHLVAASMVFGCLAIGIVGCDQKSKVTEETKIKTPGGTTTEKVTKEVTKSGDHKDGEPDATKPATP